MADLEVLKGGFRLMQITVIACISYIMSGRGGGNTLALVRQNIVEVLYVYA